MKSALPTTFARFSSNTSIHHSSNESAMNWWDTINYKIMRTYRKEKASERNTPNEWKCQKLPFCGTLYLEKNETKLAGYWYSWMVQLKKKNNITKNPCGRIFFFAFKTQCFWTCLPTLLRFSLKSVSPSILRCNKVQHQRGWKFKVLALNCK